MKIIIYSFGYSSFWYICLREYVNIIHEFSGAEIHLRMWQMIWKTGVKRMMCRKIRVIFTNITRKHMLKSLWLFWKVSRTATIPSMRFLSPKELIWNWSWKKQINLIFFSTNNRESQSFVKLDHFTWKGHYIMRARLDDRIRIQMSLNGTKFQRIHHNSIADKNMYEIEWEIKCFSKKFKKNFAILDK